MSKQPNTPWPEDWPSPDKQIPPKKPDQFLNRTACHDPCLITFTIPRDVPTGTHQLTLHSRTLDDVPLAWQTFDLEIE